MPLVDADRQVFLKYSLINVAVSPRTLLLTESGAFVSNLGATGDVVITLPASPFTGGEFYQFNVAAAHLLTISITGAPETISFVDSMGVGHSYTTLFSDVVGSTITLQGAHNNVWYITGMTGQWDNS